MLIKYLKIRIVDIPLWRYALFALFFLCAMITSMGINVDAQNPGLFEYVTEILNDPITICYYFLFAMFLLTADVYSISKSTFNDYSIFYIGSRRKWFVYNLVLISILCIIILFTSLLVNLVSYLVNYGGSNLLNNFWQNKELFVKGFNPFQGVLLSFVLIFLRLFAISFLMYFINLVTNRSAGFVGAALVSLYDRFFYEMFNIAQPLNITFLEHTRIFYTEAVAPSSENIYRSGYSLSIIFWLVFLMVLITLTLYVLKKKDFMIHVIKENS